MILLHQPSIILPAIYDIVYIHRLILDLIQNQIPFFNEHLMILVKRYKFSIEKRKTLRHGRKGAIASINSFFVLRAAVGLFCAFAASRQKGVDFSTPKSVSHYACYTKLHAPRLGGR
jgi:hypothetical protein